MHVLFYSLFGVKAHYANLNNLKLSRRLFSHFCFSYSYFIHAQFRWIMDTTRPWSHINLQTCSKLLFLVTTLFWTRLQQFLNKLDITKRVYFTMYFALFWVEYPGMLLAVKIIASPLALVKQICLWPIITVVTNTYAFNNNLSPDNGKFHCGFPQYIVIFGQLKTFLKLKWFVTCTYHFRNILHSTGFIYSTV